MYKIKVFLDDGTIIVYDKVNQTPTEFMKDILTNGIKADAGSNPVKLYDVIFPPHRILKVIPIKIKEEVKPVKRSKTVKTVKKSIAKKKGPTK